jgi:hypothetical protein
MNRLLKSGLGVAVLVVAATQYSPGRYNIIPVSVLVCAGLSTTIRSDILLDKVLVKEVGFRKRICRDTIIATYRGLNWKINEN